MRRFAAEHLLPREGDDIELGPVEILRKGRRSGIANGQALTVGGNPVAIGNTHAGGGAVPCEDHIVIEIHARQIGNIAITGFDDAGIFELQLLDGIGHPAFAEAFPSQQVDGSRAQQAPHRHFHGAGVGGGHDPDAVIGGHTQHGAGQINRFFEFGFAHFRTVRTA